MPADTEAVSCRPLLPCCAAATLPLVRPLAGQQAWLVAAGANAGGCALPTRTLLVCPLVEQQAGLVAAGAHAGGNVRPAADQPDGRVVEQQPAPQLLHQRVRLVVVPRVRNQAPVRGDTAMYMRT